METTARNQGYNLDLPFVLMDNYFIDKEVNSVTVNNEQGCYLAVRHLLKMGHQKIKDLPTAFLADNDLVAIGAMQACKELGYRVPQDISFIGNADRPISALVEPKLTTIGIPRERFGSEAVMQLIRQLEGETDTYTKVSVNGRLIQRDSVRDLSRISRECSANEAAYPSSSSACSTDQVSTEAAMASGI